MVIEHFFIIFISCDMQCFYILSYLIRMLFYILLFVHNSMYFITIAYVLGVVNFDFLLLIKIMKELL